MKTFIYRVFIIFLYVFEKLVLNLIFLCWWSDKMFSTKESITILCDHLCLLTCKKMQEDFTCNLENQHQIPKPWACYSAFYCLENVRNNLNKDAYTFKQWTNLKLKTMQVVNICYQLNKDVCNIQTVDTFVDENYAVRQYTLWFKERCLLHSNSRFAWSWGLCS